MRPRVAGGPAACPFLESKKSLARSLGLPGSILHQAFSPVWRRLVLQVHLLDLAQLLGDIGAVVGDVKFQHDGVKQHLVNRLGGAPEKLCWTSRRS
jgi:hypothetical protein